MRTAGSDDAGLVTAERAGSVAGVDGVRVHGDRLMRDAGLGSEARWIAGEERNTDSGAARSVVARQHGAEGYGELKATPVIGLRWKSSRGGSAEAGLCGGERDADWAHGGSDRIREQWLQRLGCP